MKSNIKRMLLFLAMAVVLIMPDQYTKQLAVEHLKGAERIPIIKNVLYLLYVENQGAAFGVFKGAQYMFYVITVIVLLGLLYVVYKTPVKNRYYYPVIIVSELVFAGAIGNFIDRVNQKYVVDFIYFSPIDFPVFNVADIYVTLGCMIMVFLFLFHYKDEDFAFLRLKEKKQEVKENSVLPMDQEES